MVSSNGTARRGIGVLSAGDPLVIYGTSYKRSTPEDIGDNTWLHVVGTSNGTAGSEALYIDGTPNSLSGALTATAASATDNTRIGQFTAVTSTLFYQGLIDDPAIWNTCNAFGVL